MHTAALRGVLDALQLFKQASLIRIVLGVGTFVGPYIASLFGASLVYAAYSLVLVRVISWFMHFYVVHNTALLREVMPDFVDQKVDTDQPLLMEWQCKLMVS